MGFRETRAEVIERLKNGHIQHDMSRSGEIDVKNLMLVGEISVDEVIELLKKVRGTEYSSSPHHSVSGIDVHIFKPEGWYIKCYFLDPDVVFISVHK